MPHIQGNHVEDQRTGSSGGGIDSIKLTHASSNLLRNDQILTQNARQQVERQQRKGSHRQNHFKSNQSVAGRI